MALTTFDLSARMSKLTGIEVLAAHGVHLTLMEHKLNPMTGSAWKAWASAWAIREAAR